MRFTRIHLHASCIVSFALVTALALTVCLAPVAAADPPPLARAEAAIAATHRSVHTRIVRVVAPNDSFDWTDTGIGAVAALTLVAFGLAGTQVARSRTRHAREQRAIATN
jgi:hypothetical protein